MKTAEDAKKRSELNKQIIQLQKELKELEFICHEIERHIKYGKTSIRLAEFEYPNNRKIIESRGYSVIETDHKYYQYIISWDLDSNESNLGGIYIMLEDEINRALKKINGDGSGGISGV
jgi:hypothetical protein